MEVHLKNIIRSFLPDQLLEARRYFRRKSVASNGGLQLIVDRNTFDLKRGSKILRVSSDHWTYLQHIVESFDYYFDSVRPIRVDGTLIVDMSGPRYHDLIGFDDFPLLFPSHIEPYVTTTQYLDFANLKDGSTVLDVGAYAAVTSIIFGKLVGNSGAVYAFEADERNRACASRNIELAQRFWNLNNITLVEKAVWSHGNGVEFSVEGAMGSSAVAITGRGRGPVRMVPSTTLAEFCNDHSVRRLDFLKIDIEGAEIEVLKNSRTFLRQFQPRVVIEPHHVAGSLSTEACCRILREIGYDVLLMDQVGSAVPLVAGVPQRCDSTRA